MKVRFYNFSKRKNSTLQPTSTSYNEIDVKWKDDTSMHDPSVICTGGPAVSWTYAYIPSWNKYYFVEDAISLDLNRTEYVLAEDVMASHKTEIGNTSTRVIYCTSPYYSTLNDTRIGVKTTRTIKKVNGGTVLNSTGCYVLTVLNEVVNAGGVGAAYICKESAIQAVGRWLAHEYASFSSYFNGAPMDGIFGLIWVPFTFPSNAGTSVITILIGNRDSATDGYTLSSGSVQLLSEPGGYTDNFVDTLQTNLRYPATDFRAVEPYTTGTLFLPGIGVVEVSQGDFLSGTIYVDVTRDYMTGDIFYKIYALQGALTEGEKILATYTCNVGAQCPIGQITGNINGSYGGLATMAGGLVSGIAGLATGNLGVALGGAGAVAAGAATLTLSGNRRQASVSGSVGGRGWSRIAVDGNYGKIQHVEVAMDTEDPEDSSGYIAIKGRPLDEVVTISSCNGYIECDNAQVNITGSARERDEINAMMNSGFYYE